MRIVGIDPSLTRTGVAVLDQGVCLPWVFSQPTSGKRSATLDERAGRIEAITWNVTAPADGADLVAIEAPPFNLPGGSTWDRAGMWWNIVGRLIRQNVPVVEVYPTTRAKWATGRGDAGKDAVQREVEEMWGLRVRNDDEADALALATMAAQWARLDVPTLDHQPDALDAVRWPEHDPAEGVAV